MTNAKKELLELLEKFNVELEAAVISIDTGYGDESAKAGLNPNYKPYEHDSFMIRMDTNYSSGYGIQELYGVLWFTDGTWATRWEYDGSEGWERHAKPDFNRMFNMYNI